MFQHKKDYSYSLIGKLNYETVPFLWQQSQDALKDIKNLITFDLGEVTQSDSSGVALLLAWTRDFHRKSQAVRFIHLPSQMLAIIQLAGLETILPIKRCTPQP